MSEGASAPIQRWLDEARAGCDMQVREIPRAQSREWAFDGRRLHHASEGFFSVVGAALRAGEGGESRFDQPLVDQPEIGILGFLVRALDEAPQILVQAKPEPGNVGLVQAAPSVQATESNYRRRHRGKASPFLDYFLSPGKAALVSESLQSEQGTRFLGKYNRNVVVEVPRSERIAESGAHRWVDVGDLLPLLLRDFQVNTDARSVLATVPWNVLVPGSAPFGRWRGRGGAGEEFLRSFEASEDESETSTARIAESLERLRTAAGFSTAIVGLRDLRDWEMTDHGLRPVGRGAFAVRQFAVETSQREVPRWDQPLVVSSAEGRAVLLGQERQGILHFLFAARPEIGFREKVQLGPTLQSPGDEPPTLSPSLDGRTAALQDALARSETLLSSRHSDEGGRFFRCVSRYSVCRIPRDAAVEPHEALTWMTLRQVASLIRISGTFSNEARSLVSMMLAYL